MPLLAAFYLGDHCLYSDGFFDADTYNKGGIVHYSQSSLQ